MRDAEGLLEDLGDFRLSMGIWKYAVPGRIIEQDAVIVEHGDRFGGGLWDQTRMDLAHSAIDRGRGWEPAPDWWAFHHLPTAWREAAHAQAPPTIDEGGTDCE